MGLAGSCAAGGSGAPEYGSRSAASAGRTWTASNSATTTREIRIPLILLRRALLQPASPAADVTRFANADGSSRLRQTSAPSSGKAGKEQLVPAIVRQIPNLSPQDLTITPPKRQVRRARLRTRLPAAAWLQC